MILGGREINRRSLARDNFHFIPGDENSRENHQQVVFTFCETDVGTICPRAILSCCSFIHGADRLKRIIYRLEGEVDELNTVMTRQSFLYEHGQSRSLQNSDALIRPMFSRVLWLAD
ncbi:DUF2813 domain-containing protein [Lonsdalea quercina]|uniref:DUF2813 domain-containing protein n=1 Tax=Lonsdalea quercina TaxID=71657 RepID=UPI0039753548